VTVVVSENCLKSSDDGGGGGYIALAAKHAAAGLKQEQHYERIECDEEWFPELGGRCSSKKQKNPGLALSIVSALIISAAALRAKFYRGQHITCIW
jgi:hypothetical protein